MKKRQLYGREPDQLQKIKEENRKLKQEIKRLRKMADASVDLKRLARQQYKEELDFKSKKEKLIEKWTCHKCGKGVMKLVLVSRVDGEHYFRSCSRCDNRTKIQEYTEKVKGIE